MLRGMTGEQHVQLHREWLSWVESNLGRNPARAEVAAAAAVNAIADGLGYNEAVRIAALAFAVASIPSALRPPNSTVTRASDVSTASELVPKVPDVAFRQPSPDGDWWWDGRQRVSIDQLQAQEPSSSAVHSRPVVSLLSRPPIRYLVGFRSGRWWKRILASLIYAYTAFGTVIGLRDGNSVGTAGIWMALLLVLGVFYLVQLAQHYASRGVSEMRVASLVACVMAGVVGALIAGTIAATGWFWGDWSDNVAPFLIVADTLIAIASVILVVMAAWLPAQVPPRRAIGRARTLLILGLSLFGWLMYVLWIPTFVLLVIALVVTLLADGQATIKSRRGIDHE